MKKILSPLFILITIGIQAQLKVSTMNDNGIAPGQVLQVNGSDTPVSTTNTTKFGKVFSVNLEGRVGIGTNQPNSNLDITWDGTTGATGPSNAARTTIALKNVSSGGHHYYFNSEGYLSSNPGGFTIWDGTAEATRFIIEPNGKIGIGTTQPSTLLHVNGTITANEIQGPSDKRFKKNIKPLENSLEKIISLNGYTYEWRRDEFPEKNFRIGTNIGLIAQEVEEIFPDVVFTSDDSFKSKSIDYAKLIPVLIESIKDLKSEIEELKSQISDKKKQ